jgi:hypothetical protein
MINVNIAATFENSNGKLVHSGFKNSGCAGPLIFNNFCCYAN